MLFWQKNDFTLNLNIILKINTICFLLYLRLYKILKLLNNAKYYSF